MRCQMVTNPAPSDKDPIESDIGIEEDGGGQTTGYGLRETPRSHGCFQVQTRLLQSKNKKKNKNEEEGN